MFNITTHQRQANKNYYVISPQSCRDDCFQKMDEEKEEQDKKSTHVGEDVEKLKSSHTIGWNGK